MQLLKTLFVAAAIAPSALARLDPIPTSTDAAEYLSSISGLPTITGSAATSIASALYSVQVKYENDSQFPTVVSCMFTAAAKATGGPDRVASMVISGWNVVAEMEEDWWKDGVPDKEKKFVSKYSSDWSKAIQMQTMPTQTSKGGAPKCTGMAVAGVAAGLAAGVMVAI